MPAKYTNLDTYISDQYRSGRSIESISTELGTYPNFVKRSLVRQQVEIRNRSEAQKNALNNGAKHPTKGKTRTKEERESIGKGLSTTWKNYSTLTKEHRSNISKEIWNNKTPAERADMQLKANRAVRKAASDGSKLELYIFNNLKEKYQCTFHTTQVLESEQLEMDIMVHDPAIAIEINGPGHYKPIWGEKRLAKQKEADARKYGLLVNKGYHVIVVKNVLKNMSKTRMLKLLEKVTKQIDSIKNNRPELQVWKITEEGL